MSKEEKKACVISFSNHKGGVGKSCSTCNIGASLARRGKKVLLVDLDPQANLSLSLGLKDVEKSIYNVLNDQIAIADCIYNILGTLEIVPANLDLAGAEIELSSEAGREVILKESLSSVSHLYDYILIDCAPSLGLLTTNALTASDQIYIPVQAQYLSLQGITKLTTVIDKIKRRLNKNLKVGGVFITQFDSRKVLNRDIAEAIEKHFKEKCLKTRVRDNVALAEAPGRGQDIFRYSPKSHGAADYAAIADEIIKRNNVKKLSEV